MVKKICLDSDIIINLLHGEPKTKQLLEKLDAEFFMTTINSFEIWQGRKNNELIFEFLESTPLLAFDQKAALKAGDITKDLRKQGNPLEIRDVFIAAICITQNIELLTLNKKHFERLEKYGLILTK